MNKLVNRRVSRVVVIFAFIGMLVFGIFFARQTAKMAFSIEEKYYQYYE
ncbi:MAG: hypothetical protein KBF62_02520 [Candidatus Pacebacteria bacterium]|nr:hypothetical protein [Candidatus Paceibacterota bacterium]MBP9058490.1 hypothetical protein [Candidatus Paceibacterota bacterium]MBP9770463.1 hypothetical protein [Candidatus Paceibacterota bacterium]